MDFKIQPIVTKRLRLRAIELSDAEDLCAFKQGLSIDKAKSFISEQLETRPEKKQPETWAIVLKEEDKMIGTIEFDALNKRTFEADVRFELNEAYRNQGYMKEALKAVIQFGFKSFQLNAIYGRCQPLNYAATKVMHHVGMDYEDSFYDINHQLEEISYKIDNMKRRND